MKELTVITSNSVGTLARVAEELGASGINIEAISAYGLGDRAIFRIITGDVKTALKVLSRLPDVEVKEADTVIYKMINRPGELGKVARKLANHGINLESIYIVSRKNDFTEVAINPANPKDVEKIKEILKI